MRNSLLVAGALVVGFASCGGDDPAAVRTVTLQETATPAPAGDPVLIETRIINAREHKGEVARGSVIGERSFCSGGKTSGGSDGPTITTTFHCTGGTLRIHYAPTQRSRVQGSVWEVETGTGRFEGLRGGGTMTASFDRDDGDTGREVFTGNVGR